jgi:hypothetical protein
MKDKNNVFDLTEFAYSENVVKDFPKLIHIYEQLLPTLSAYSHYTVAWQVREAVLDALSLAHIQYDYYSHINEIKGKVE